MKFNNQSGVVSWKSPSNIAFVKYWGKTGRQLPMNPSISMTLCESFTHMTVDFKVTENKNETIIDKFELQGNENESFKLRLEKFLNSIEDQCSFIKHLKLEIKSENSFPHSAGIASSASALSALSLCLVTIESMLNGIDEINFEKASVLSRLGSGSACRSIYSEFAMWGFDEVIGSRNEYATKFQVADEFKNLKDAILIVDSKPKKVSSSLGHDKMNNHPYAQARFLQAKNNFRSILKSMEEGDWKTFGEILEDEALTLHALMMTSSPSFILLKPQSLEIIDKVRDFRNKTGLNLYFTIDAGPNIHLIYPQNQENEILPFLDIIKCHCENSKIIFDKIGHGPELVSRNFNG